VPAPPRLVRIRLASLVVAAAVSVAAMGACGDEPSSAPGDCTPITDGTQTLVAENLAWDISCLGVDQGTDIAFTVDLRDTSVDHNLALSGPSGRAKTPLERGPRRQSLRYEASEAGRHPFVCDIHPAMEGDLFVDPADGG